MSSTASNSLFSIFAGMLALACVTQAVLAADPGAVWLTEGAASDIPSDGVQWLPPESLCPVLKEQLPEAVKALTSWSFAALDLKALSTYADPRCKGKYGQLPFLVRAVSASGEGHLNAGLLKSQVWMRFAGMGGKHPFEKTPVVLWLFAPPSKVHVTASVVE